ncbi:DUF1800 domain-containing protein [Asticcacaulis benevestitus]|uniref:DUF1800 family protein n=1 Tax=Asticcacaulis benevestitus DSM 16100 = ATCC BAA-896 TaxID=1121022 RepID=V4PRJ2_9CAUL|nr:DUF1800 family protein [Asticcacaulis benevestitus]ESQ88115.1 hypothetical protein ABENE_16430 [Asticcacaulis benevestitus DSM 16100 = ATCC BAA-896]
MSISAVFESALALSRFGLGSGVDGVSAVSNARDSLHQEITEGAPEPQGADLKTTPDLFAALYIYQQEKKGIKDGKAGAPVSAISDMAMTQALQPKKDKPDFNPVRDAALTEADVRFNDTIKSPVIGFNERLVMFWANHFAVAVKKSQSVAITAGAYEREAIRPHIFGHFSDLLLAAETHPCMLDYLDNQQSIGPQSPANRKGTRGLNENLAREIMELHTMGVGSGYTQADVTAFAKVITGWTFSRTVGKAGAIPGTFAFNKRAHEPGPQTILGKTYPDSGFDQGKAVLLDLARHPATAQHIATKLARHFVADDPPAPLVAKLADVFRRTDGDLRAVSTALIEAEESWTPHLTRFRSPLIYLSALIRGTGIRMKPAAIIQALNNMGQPIWQPSGPNGFPDTMAAWASPEALSTRLDVVNALADRADPSIDPRDFARSRLGALLSDQTRDAVAHAETRAQGLSLVLLSPEFMRC